MIDYLNKYNVDILNMKKIFNNDIINKFDVMETNVSSILEYLKSLGINDFNELIINRPDIFFNDIVYLKEKMDKIDKELIKYIIENDSENLINFDI